MSYQHDPTKPYLALDDVRMTRVMHERPQACATVNEYSAITGIDVGRVLDLLGAALDRGELDLEPVGGEVFVHTAPSGRPRLDHQAQVPPNLWELLRASQQREQAYVLWRLIRDLEAGSWDVEPDPRRLPRAAQQVPLLGLRFGAGIVPLLVLPQLDSVAAQAGPLTLYERSGFGLCALTCRHQELDAATTAVRKWMLERPARTGLDVLVLEAPRYQPVLLTADDGGITPRNVTAASLKQAPQL